MRGRRGRDGQRDLDGRYRGTAQGALIQAISGENLMFDLTGMTALVTGASGGIGSAIAQALAAQGARLAVSGSNADKLNAFRDTLGGDHVALPCNLGRSEEHTYELPSLMR